MTVTRKRNQRTERLRRQVGRTPVPDTPWFVDLGIDPGEPGKTGTSSEPRSGGDARTISQGE